MIPGLTYIFKSQAAPDKTTWHFDRALKAVLSCDIYSKHEVAELLEKLLSPSSEDSSLHELKESEATIKHDKCCSLFELCGFNQNRYYNNLIEINRPLMYLVAILYLRYQLLIRQHSILPLNFTGLPKWLEQITGKYVTKELVKRMEEYLGEIKVSSEGAIYFSSKKYIDFPRIKLGQLNKYGEHNWYKAAYPTRPQKLKVTTATLYGGFCVPFTWDWLLAFSDAVSAAPAKRSQIKNDYVKRMAADDVAINGEFDIKEDIKSKITSITRELLSRLEFKLKLNYLQEFYSNGSKTIAPLIIRMINLMAQNNLPYIFGDLRVYFIRKPEYRAHAMGVLIVDYGTCLKVYLYDNGNNDPETWRKTLYLKFYMPKDSHVVELTKLENELQKTNYLQNAVKGRRAFAMLRCFSENKIEDFKPIMHMDRIEFLPEDEDIWQTALEEAIFMNNVELVDLFLFGQFAQANFDPRKSRFCDIPNLVWVQTRYIKSFFYSKNDERIRELFQKYFAKKDSLKQEYH